MAKTPEQWLATRRERWSEAFELVERGEASQRVRECVELVERKGLGMREIATQLGLGVSTVGQYLNDPTGVKTAERKARSQRPCVDCGRPCNTDGSVTEPSERCGECAPKHASAVARRGIIEAIQDWHGRYGKPPTALDWNVAMAHGTKTHPARLDFIEKAHRDRIWPAVSGVQRVFGSWNAALEAAGMPTLKPGERLDPETWKQHMKGRKMLSPVTVIEREIDKNEQRRETLAAQIAELERNLEQLEQAKELLSSNGN